MKNLKKVLSLGLALVMLLGMFTVVSAAETKKIASDLTDWNTVVHKDAVSLMVDLGIIVGTDKGSFDPTGNIDRASWAKMVFYAANGHDNADAYLGTATGLNDIAGNWAESYISFLKANNYISGDNFGNYNPSNNVTVAEACKMMLTVLGYDAEDRGYQNNVAWAGNIMKDAQRDGLMDNVDAEMTPLTPLTRENAAEIVLNALNANMVQGEPQWDNGKKYIAKYTKLYTLGYEVFDMVKVTAIVDGIDKDGLADIKTVTAPTASLVNGGALFDVASNITNKVKAPATVVGEEVNVYVKADGFKWDSSTGEINTVGTFKSMISSAAAKSASNPVKVLTGGFTLDEVTERSSVNYVATGISPKVACYYNGEGVDKDDTTFKTNIQKRGTVAEFYLGVDGQISVIKAYYYTVKQVDADVATKTLSDGTLQVRVPGVLNGYVDADKVTGWQGLEAGDVVLYYETTPVKGGTADKVYTIEKAEMISGKVDTHSDKTLTIDGQKYRVSEQNVQYTDVDVTSANSLENWTKSHALADEFNFWLDKNGSIVVAELVTESMDKSKVCLVIETEVTDGALGSTGSLAANLLFVDGSTEIVKVSKVATNGGDLKTVVDDGKISTVPATAAKQIEASDAQEILAGKGTSKNPDPKALTKFFNYRDTSTGYELTELSSAVNDGRDWEDAVSVATAANETPVTIMKESAFAKSDAAGTSALKDMLTANLSTTFIIGKRDAADNSVTYTVAKGFRELHEMDAHLVTAIAVNVDPNATEKKNKVAKYVYLETGAFKDDAPDGYVFITDNGWQSDPELAEDDVFLVNIVDTDGTATTMRVDAALKNTISKESTKLKDEPDHLRKFWQIGTIDENRVVTSLGSSNDSGVYQDGQPVELKTIASLGDGVITFEGGDAWDYDDATKFIYVNMGWDDDEEDKANKIGVREPSRDNWVLNDCGTFKPDGFYDETDIDPTGSETDTAEDDNPNGKTYIKVMGCAIVPANSTTADYVYVVRYLW